MHISKFAVTEARTCSAQQDSMVLAFSRHSWHCSPPQPLQMLSMQDDTHASRGDKWVWKPNMWNPKKPNCCNLNAEKDLGNEVPHFSHKHTHTLRGNKNSCHNSSSCRNGLLVLPAQLTLLTPTAAAFAFDAIVHGFGGAEHQQQAQEEGAGHGC